MFYNVFENCYATGEIKGTNNVGGLVGINNITATIRNCAALNNVITATNGTTINRILAGGAATLQNNYAYEDMDVNGSKVISTNAASANGLDISKSDTTEQTTYEDSLGWVFNVTSGPWKWGGDFSLYTLPVLYWQTTYPELPVHLNE